ncbi:MAG: metal ABC transporter permease [Sulfuritalea sp.]|nr:metal ABC transporter permease [Sulfuritalea sp.]
MASLFDDLFVVPFFAGLAVALLLPLVGNLLRLRDEWLATLGLAHLAAATGLIGMAFGVPPIWGARLFPEHEVANRLPAWRWHLGFDLLSALAIAAATATVGLMGAFALIFLPSWLAFRLAPDWRRANLLAVAIGAGGYTLAFALALALDQPFAPVLAAVLIGLFALGARGGRRAAGADFPSV